MLEPKRPRDGQGGEALGKVVFTADIQQSSSSIEALQAEVLAGLDLAQCYAGYAAELLRRGDPWLAARLIKRLAGCADESEDAMRQVLIRERRRQ